MVAVNLTVNSSTNSIMSTESTIRDPVLKNDRISEQFMYFLPLQKPLTDTEIFQTASEIISWVWESVCVNRERNGNGRHDCSEINDAYYGLGGYGGYGLGYGGYGYGGL